MDQVIPDRQFKFLGWDSIDNACLSLYSQMVKDKYVPEAIVGLMRGGAVPARILADYFGIVVDFFALDVKLYDGIGVTKVAPIMRYAFKHGDIENKKVLIIDDIYDSGRTMRAVQEHFKGHNIATATLHWKENAKEKPNYYAETVTENIWLIYPWEQMEFKREMQTKIGTKTKSEKAVAEVHRKISS